MLKKKDNKGFTLVELLVVIAVPALFSNINKAKIADMEADYSAYKSAALSYYSDENRLPTTQDDLKPYMESVPTESPFGTKYVLTTDSGENLVLTTKLNNELKDKETEKLEKDLGKDVVTVNGIDIIMKLIKK